jgi:nitrile hydratase
MQTAKCKFRVGDAVSVAMENPKGNPRTPRYIRGKRGIIHAVHGVLENPKDHRGLYRPLYTVRFALCEVSPCRDQDSVCVDVHEEWLMLQPQETN